MKFAYMPDTHFGYYDQAIPGPQEVHAAFQHLIAEAETAEHVGFDGIFLPERHSRTETFVPSPLTVATAIAARTSRITIATTVLLPTLYNPMHLAEQASLIDNLSKGRFVLGVGTGYHKDYHEMFGVPWPKRGKRFEEAMEVLTRAFTGENFSFHGEFFDIENVLLTPRPYQRPKPPIWIGTHAKGRPLDRALDYDGWVLWTQPDWDELEERVKEMRQRAEQRGKTGWQVVLDQDGWIGDDPAQVRSTHAPRWLRETNFYEEHGFPDAEINPADDISHETGAEKALHDFEKRQMHFGTPETWTNRIAEIEQRFAPDWLNIRTRGPAKPEAPYPSFEESIETIERFGNDVISKFK